MSNRIVVLSAAGAFAAYAAVAATLVFSSPASADEIVASTADHPQIALRATAADAAATQSPGTVGAMHYAVAGLATDVSAVRRQGGQATAATVRWLPSPAQPAS
ncbi:MAG: hypothetical protein DI565_06935 [Ancylobacter novellus]|uniref:Uncharacterized protein n=1 Tax=Ancylobacter novellus TaxID=921 RepID=A0A2W5KNS5_ANCNO|nr:MAG: hypothetical protein DI565_06935 [Ancylobacter novellus]